MQLRPYQTDIKNRIRNAYRQFSAPCVVLPCGGGKSCIIADIARSATERNNRVLVLVHRKELREQLERTFTDWSVNMKLCDINMVQSTANKIETLPDYQFIITDENHHGVASTYQKVYDNYPDAKRLGVTATPVRTGEGGLAEINDTLIVGVSAKWLIENKYLAPYQYYVPRLNLDFSGVSIKQGDYDQNEAEQIVSS